MGIYLPDMEMPKDVTLLAISPDGTVDIVSGQPDLSYVTLKHKAVPVPPHGRLIDADVTGIYRREERVLKDIEVSPFSEYLEGVKDGLHEAAKCLSTAPTIIPAEEGET